MSVFNLTYATTTKVVNTLRQSLAGDPLFQPDKTSTSRSAESIVLDAFGYQVRDFPVVVVTGVPGANRRMDFGDRVAPFFGVQISEEAGGTNILRTFDVQQFVLPGATVNLRYAGANAALLNPPGPYVLQVAQKMVGPNLVNYITLVGPNVGPPATFPLASFEADTTNAPTGKIFGGWFDMSVEISIFARSTQTRELIADRVWSLLWFLKKPALRALGVVVLDVRHIGFGQEPYGADLLYQSKFSVSVATEFESIVLFPGTAVTDVDVQAAAMDPS